SVPRGTVATWLSSQGFHAAGMARRSGGGTGTLARPASPRLRFSLAERNPPPRSGFVRPLGLPEGPAAFGGGPLALPEGPAAFGAGPPGLPEGPAAFGGGPL